METTDNGVNTTTENGIANTPVTTDNSGDAGKSQKSCNVFNGVSALCDCDMCKGLTDAEKTLECARAHLKKESKTDDVVITDKEAAIEAITHLIEFCERADKMRMEMGKTLSETMEKLFVSQKTAQIGENAKTYILNAGQALISKINELKVERGLMNEGSETDSEQVKNARKIVRDAVDSIDFTLADWRREWVENIKEKDVTAACDPGMAEARAAWDKICGGTTPDEDPNAPGIVNDPKNLCEMLQK